MISETVKIHVKLWARPQLIAPHGRWHFEITGRNFVMKDPDYYPSLSPRGATNTARRMCKRLGFRVGHIEMEPVT